MTMHISEMFCVQFIFSTKCGLIRANLLNFRSLGKFLIYCLYIIAAPCLFTQQLFSKWMFLLLYSLIIIYLKKSSLFPDNEKTGLGRKWKISSKGLISFCKIQELMAEVLVLHVYSESLKPQKTSNPCLALFSMCYSSEIQSIFAFQLPSERGLFMMPTKKEQNLLIRN